MLRVMLQKVWNKKWMSFCLVLGIALLVATAVSFPMYRHAAYNRMLQDEFRDYISKEGSWPTLNSLSYTSRKEEGGATAANVEKFANGLAEKLGVTSRGVISFYCTERSIANSLMERTRTDELGMRVGFMTGLEDRVDIVAGEMTSESGIAEDGAVEAMITMPCMVNCNVLLGETIEFNTLHAPDGGPLRVRIVGTFEAADPDDDYWQVKPESWSNVLLVRESVFRDYFTGERAGDVTFTMNCFAFWEYEDIESSQVEELLERTEYQSTKGSFASVMGEEEYTEILLEYQGKEQRINMILFLLQVPIWILLGAFLFMISTQIYDVEGNEIAVMKSRGSSGWQIFLSYLYQSVFLSILGTLAGLLLGRLFAAALGSTRAFLEFQASQSLPTIYTPETFGYALLAACACVCMVTLPAIKHSRISIVNLKQQKARHRFSWWEKCCLDIICLAAAIFLYYVCSRYYSVLLEMATALGREKELNSLMVIGAPLFIIGAGLLLIRLQPLIIGLIYLVGKKFWGPAAYISFMENRKNGRKQQFLMLFLILSISLGMYHSIAARSILENALENRDYLDGADLIVKEYWSDNSSITYENVAATLTYTEPDFSKYSDLPCAKSMTKVIRNENAALSGSEYLGMPLTMLGIHTRQFGMNVKINPQLLEKPYYEYLNELAVAPEGVLLSSYFRDVFGFEVGDKLDLYNGSGKKFTAQIVDFVDYWPGVSFSRKDEVTLPKLLAVVNIGTLTNEFGNMPYEVWINTGGESTDSFYDWVKKYDVRVEKYVDKAADLEAVVEDPLLQGTNGVLTLGFLVTILLCAVGYLIYWILSIRSREMVFGILRAEGMHRGEVFHLLINEQLFCGGFSVAAGALIGYVSSRMFVPILQIAYAVDRELPIQLITQRQDMFRLYGVVVGMLLLCLLMLVGLLYKLDIAKALKLGEE